MQFKELAKLLQTQMSRKDFLKQVVFIAITITGVGAILKAVLSNEYGNADSNGDQVQPITKRYGG